MQGASENLRGQMRSDAYGAHCLSRTKQACTGGSRVKVSLCEREQGEEHSSVSADVGGSRDTQSLVLHGEMFLVQ